MLIDVLIHNFYRTRDVFLFGKTKVKKNISVYQNMSPYSTEWY